MVTLENMHVKTSYTNPYIHIITIAKRQVHEFEGGFGGRKDKG